MLKHLLTAIGKLTDADLPQTSCNAQQSMNDNRSETSVENMVLLCTSHHKLVHEGGFQIYRDQSGELFFHSPDRKAVPHSGYHRDD